MSSEGEFNFQLKNYLFVFVFSPLSKVTANYFKMNVTKPTNENILHMRFVVVYIPLFCRYVGTTNEYIAFSITTSHYLVYETCTYVLVIGFYSPISKCDTTIEIILIVKPVYSISTKLPVPLREPTIWMDIPILLSLIRS